MPDTRGIALGGAARSLLASRELDIREDRVAANKEVALGNLALANQREQRTQRNDLRTQMIDNGVVPFVENVQTQLQGLIDNGVDISQPRYQEFIAKRKAFAAQVLNQAISAGVTTPAEAQTYLSAFDAMGQSVVGSGQAAEVVAKGTAIGKFQGERDVLDSTPFETLPGVKVHAILTDGRTRILDATDRGFRDPDTLVKVPAGDVRAFAEDPSDLDNSGALNASISNSIRTAVRNQLGIGVGQFGALKFIGEPGGFIQNLKQAQALEGPVTALAEQYFRSFGGSMGANGAADRALQVTRAGIAGPITNPVDVSIIEQAAVAGTIDPGLAQGLIQPTPEPPPFDPGPAGQGQGVTVPIQDVPSLAPPVATPTAPAALPAAPGLPAGAQTAPAAQPTAPVPDVEAEPVGSPEAQLSDDRVSQVAQLFTSDTPVPTQVAAKFEPVQQQLSEQTGMQHELSGESISGEDLARIDPNIGPEAVGNGRAYAVWRREGPGKFLVGLILDDELAAAVRDPDAFVERSDAGLPGVGAAATAADARTADAGFLALLNAWKQTRDPDLQKRIAAALAGMADTDEKKELLRKAVEDAKAQRGARNDAAAAARGDLAPAVNRVNR